LNKTLNYLALLLLLSSLIAGCSSSIKNLSMSTPDPGIINEMIETYNEMQRFEADFTVKVKISVMGGSASGHIQFEGQDRIKAKYKGPLSAFSGELVVKDGLYELTQSNGGVSVDSVENLNFADMTGIPFPSSDLNTLFKPFPSPVASDSYTEDFYVENKGDSLWVWKIGGESLDRTIFLNPSDGTVVEEKWTNSRNKTVLTKSYDGYVKLRGRTFARKIKVVSKGRIPVEYTLTYDQVRVDPKWKKSPFVFLTVNRP